MKTQSFILPVNRTAGIIIRRWLHNGHLRVTDERLPGTNGRVHTLSPVLLATIRADDDFHLHIGQERIGVPIYRMPEWEYSTLVRASSRFHQHQVNHLTEGLMVARPAFQIGRWITELVDALSVAPLIGPHPLTVGERWSQGGRFLPEATRLIQRNMFWEIHLCFELPLTRDLDGHGLVLGIDVGLRPLVTVALENGGHWSTGGIVKFSAADWRQLSVAATAAGVDPALAEQTCRLIRYAAARQLIEDGFFIPVAQTARAVVAERLNYNGFQRCIVRQMREEAIRDFLTTWLPQRMAAWDIQLVQVNPAFTSQDCSCCTRRNTEQLGNFVCAYCGYTTIIHVNAAQNVLRRGLPEVH